MVDGIPLLSGHPGVEVLVCSEGYAVMTLKKEPVNSMDLDMWTALETALDKLEADPAVRALIITSGLQRDVFSAGNDLMELYAPKTSLERYRQFWLTSNRFLVKLHRSRLATVAAVLGASPAGGCIMAMCCDHRIMTTSGHIGLNEVILGIPVPKYWGLLMARLVGHKVAEKVLLTGTLMSPQEALGCGLIDELVEAKEMLLPLAEKRVAGLLRLPTAAYATTKASLRGSFCTEWEGYFATEPDGAWKFLQQPATLAVLEAAMARLSSGNKGAGQARAKL